MILISQMRKLSLETDWFTLMHRKCDCLDLKGFFWHEVWFLSIYPHWPDVLRFMGSQRVGHDWATELNWTESVMLWTSTLSVSNIALDILRKHEFWTGRTQCRLGNRKDIFQAQWKVLSDIWEAASQRKKSLVEAGGWKELCALTLTGWILFIFS